MGPTNGINLAKVKYFSIEEYVNKIKLTDNLLNHMEETNKEFDKYLQKLAQYDDETIIYYWIISLEKEITYSNLIEKHYIDAKTLLDNDVFFDNFQMSHSRIKRLHQIAIDKKFDSEPECYRKKEARVSRITQSKMEEIFWYGAEPEDLKPFMDDFIKFYKANSLSSINNNPFLKSALAHLIFVRIHPFSDGNGRTARMIHNIKFTEAINKIYGTNLRLCPLNLSQSILINQPTYAKRINNIYFDLEHDCNQEINQWFDFILNMVDEQLYKSTNHIPTLEKIFENTQRIEHITNSSIPEQINEMKIKKKTLIPKPY